MHVHTFNQLLLKIRVIDEYAKLNKKWIIINFQSSNA